jgi:hypothetical protein
MTNETKQVHHADCGDVGETGEHGDLGSNAAGAEREAAAASTEAKPAGAVLAPTRPFSATPPANPLVTHNTGK